MTRQFYGRWKYSKPTEHLPECHHSTPDLLLRDFPVACICPELRTREQRVREEDQRSLIKYGVQMFMRGKQYGRPMGYAAGLDAAREAVAAKSMHSPKCFALLPDFDERDCNCAVAYSLAAIDALREEQK